ncbi:hypothetical protein [Aquirhabdus parva]|uniref:Uncharacterized protein n=1 Tax=Aquirhabdus parva TaxID=2283318 RepID=A0A345P7L1_9GAMM|nr:hypothetical protein [Aquirhabdus parva]AXI03270.1 hypothetical protein HYN46_10720 [Aquirhabdus parva]
MLKLKYVAAIIPALIFSSTYGHAESITQIPKNSAFSANILPYKFQSYDQLHTTIHNNFTAVIDENIGNATPAHLRKLFDNLSDRELKDLATAYTNALNGKHANTLDSFAKKLDGKRLLRLEKAFGYLPVSVAVSAQASPEVRSYFEVNAKRLSVPQTGGVHTLASPTIDMTIPEIYLEYRTAPVGSLSVGGALVETATFVGVRVAGAYGVGNYIGNQVHQLIETYDPDIDDKIGGTLDSALRNLNNAATSLQQGQYEKAVDDVFGGWIQDSGVLGGDYGVMGAMESFILMGGANCNPDDALPNRVGVITNATPCF